MSLPSSGSDSLSISFHSIRNVTSPEDQDAGRKRLCGTIPISEFAKVSTEENVRRYLGEGTDGAKRKSTAVNMAVRRTLQENPDLFCLLNSGGVIVARKADVDDNKKVVRLRGPSIINGAQTQGVIKEVLAASSDEAEIPSINIEIIVTDDEELIADISIARNFQNRVADLSIYGRQNLFDELEKSLRRHDKTIDLRKSETDFDKDLLDTEKIIQCVTAIAPPTVSMPSASDARRQKSPETQFRVYAYRHRARCLKDFALVMESPADWPDANSYILDVAWDVWQLYQRLRSEQAFSGLHKVKGESVSGKKVVANDGVPDGVVFPMLSALSRFIRRSSKGWKLDIPSNFPWQTLYRQAMVQLKTTASHNPQTMGKDADCYVALHGAIDMYFAVSEMSED
jgi:AIPR protein